MNVESLIHLPILCCSLAAYFVFILSLVDCSRLLHNFIMPCNNQISYLTPFSMLMQVGELAGLAIGATVLLNVMIAAYVIMITMHPFMKINHFFI